MSVSRKPFIRDAATIGALAAPLILTQLAQVALTTTDIVMMGMLGPSEIAAGGLALAIFNQLRTMGTGLVTGTGNLVAHASAAGGGDSDEIRRLVRASFALSTLAALAFALLMPLVETPLVWLGQAPAVARQTAVFLTAAAPGMLPCLWFQSLRQYTVGRRKPGPLLAITLASIVVNAGLDYALMFGRFGLPRLGLAGIACATSVVYLLSFLAFLVIVRARGELARDLSLALWRTDRASLARIWKMGLPIAATYGSEAAFFTVLTLVVGTLGVEALAAQTIVNQVVYIAFMISVGLSHASSISISHACATHDYRGARRLGYTGLALGVGAMLLVALPYLAAPMAVLAPFFDGSANASANVMRLATGLLAIAALTQVFDCSQNIGVGLLRGLGEVRSTLRFSVIGYWAIGLPLAYAFGIALGFGIGGIWVGLTAGLAATATLLVRAFERRLRSLVGDGLGDGVGAGNRDVAGDNAGDEYRNRDRAIDDSAGGLATALAAKTKMSASSSSVRASANVAPPMRLLMLAFLLIAALFALGLASLSVGDVSLHPVDALRALVDGDGSNPIAVVVRELRLPRFAAALLVGASLAVAGALMQGITRNPLADPTLTGVVSGAACAVVAVVVLAPSVPEAARPFIALAGGAGAATLTFLLAAREQFSPLRLALAGTTVAALGSAVVVALTMAAGPQAGPLFYWLAGGLSGVGWREVAVMALWSAAGIAAAWALARVLDGLALGDEAAQSIGIDLLRWRLTFGMVAVGLSAAVVATAGPVGFVGLGVPHLVRLAVGAGHRRMLPFAALVGALVVGAADLVARTVAAPREVPLGFLTALAAAPFLIALIRRDAGARA
ncbi:MAG TPA: iron chelate uptake ABC transporter family permease subunit [Trinickia sp.]|nr:iron chelate uptake ABC transporter family permease subunit [Trinickia sp.]